MAMPSASSFRSALCLFLALVVVVELIEQAAAVRLERPVVNARRPAGLGRGVECSAALSLRVVADDEVARDQIDLLPMVVHERRGGVDAGIEAQQAGTATHLAALVEVARENFLLDPRGVAGRRGPAALHVHAGKFKMRFVHRHGSSPATVASSCAPPWTASVPHKIKGSMRGTRGSNIRVQTLGSGEHGRTPATH